MIQASWGSPVHIIAQEQVVGVWCVACNLEDLHQVMELTVRVPHDHNRCPHMRDIALTRQQLLQGVGLQGALLRHVCISSGSLSCLISVQLHPYEGLRALLCPPRRAQHGTGEQLDAPRLCMLC